MGDPDDAARVVVSYLAAWVVVLAGVVAHDLVVVVVVDDNLLLHETLEETWLLLPLLYTAPRMRVVVPWMEVVVPVVTSVEDGGRSRHVEIDVDLA